MLPGQCKSHRSHAMLLPYRRHHPPKCQGRAQWRTRLMQRALARSAYSTLWRRAESAEPCGFERELEPRSRVLCIIKYLTASLPLLYHSSPWRP
jgi:hypothetical protein